MSELIPVTSDVQAIKRNYCAVYYIEFNESKLNVGKIELSAYIDTEAWYILIGVSASQKKTLMKYLDKNKIEYCEWLYNEDIKYEDWLYLQLEKYDVLEPEEVIANKFKELLRVVLES